MIHRLLEKYRQGTCSDTEKQLLAELFEQWHAEDNIQLTDAEQATAEAEMWARLRQQLKPVRRFPVLKVAAAAVILAVLSFSTYYFLVKEDLAPEQQLQVNDVAPGGDKALLKLSNGRTVELRGDKNGIIVGAQGITYADGSDALGGKDQLDDHQVRPANVITTPPGGQYQMTLPDGSKVWLNAASSLSYPSRFGESERRVYLTGEAYFEVAHADGLRFVVETAHQEVNVLGTHFNVNVYEDEPLSRTTLLAGRVEVLNRETQKAQALLPGQQSELNGDKIAVKEVNAEEYIAWKDGSFQFNDTDLKSVMRQLSRWYNVEVVGLDRLPENRYNGKLPKDINLSKVLQVLELTSGLKFTINGERRIELMD